MFVLCIFLEFGVVVLLMCSDLELSGGALNSTVTHVTRLRMDSDSSADKLRHPRSDAYLAKQVLLNFNYSNLIHYDFSSLQHICK